jgi:hypothetical protein
MKRSQKLFVASLLALAVSGCAVKSEPIERSVSEQRAKSDLQSMYKGQEPLSGPLTLHQAMARAVKYNLEGRLKIMEEALAKRQLDLASFGHVAAHGAGRRVRRPQQRQRLQQPERTDRHSVAGAIDFTGPRP